MTGQQFIFALGIIFSLFFAVRADAGRPLTCVDLSKLLPRTFGVEIEQGSMIPAGGEMMGPLLKAATLAIKDHFRIFGRMQNGLYAPNYIPKAAIHPVNATVAKFLWDAYAKAGSAAVVREQKAARLDDALIQTQFIQLEELSDGGLRILNWDRANSIVVDKFVNWIIQLRLHKSKILFLGAIDESRPDQFPLALDEEWRGNKFVGFEAAMRGYVSQATPILDWTLRAGNQISYQTKNYREIPIHLHERFSPKNLTAAEKKYLYQAIKERWGSLNDFAFLSHRFDLGSSLVGAEEFEALSQFIIPPVRVETTAFDVIQNHLNQTSIRPLTREMYDAVRVSSRGVRVLGPGLGSWTDNGSLPADWKFLYAGLRGIYEKQNWGRVWTDPGIEYRWVISGSAVTQLSITAGDPLTESVALGKIRWDHRDFSRGFVGGKIGVRKIFEAHQMEDYFEKAEEMIDYLRILDTRKKWRRDQLRVELWFPLQRVECHALKLDVLNDERNLCAPLQLALLQSARARFIARAIKILKTWDLAQTPEEKTKATNEIFQSGSIFASEGLSNLLTTPVSDSKKIEDILTGLERRFAAD